MTLLRGAAITLVKLVSRLSSRESRVWAQAMLAELSYIESDWAALRWAFGSMTVLFAPQTESTMTMSDIPAAAKALTNRMTQRTWVSGAFVAAMAAFFTRQLLHQSNPLQRAGCALLVVATLYMLFQLVRARPHKGSTASDLIAQASHYGSELGREWNFHRGPSLWSRLVIIILGPLLLGIGGIIANPSSATSNIRQMLMFLFIAAFAIPKSRHYANRYAAQLHQLEQLHHDR